MSLEEFKYRNTTKKENVYNDSQYYKHIQNSQKFFVKPHIAVYGLNKNPVIVEVTEIGDNPEIFTINVWTLEVENIEKKIRSCWPFKYIPHILHIDKIPYYSKISKKVNFQLSSDASRCLFKFNVIDNHKPKYSEHRPLRWRTSDLLPIRCNTGTVENPDQGRRTIYVDRLPSIYMDQLFINEPIVELPKKTSRDIFLFFTFYGSNSLYFIPYFGKEHIFRSEDDVPPLTFPLEKEFELSIKWEISQYGDSDEGVSYKVIPKSWNDIRIERIDKSHFIHY